jgi:hypothetical protein
VLQHEVAVLRWHRRLTILAEYEVHYIGRPPVTDSAAGLTRAQVSASRAREESRWMRCSAGTFCVTPAGTSGMVV